MEQKRTGKLAFVDQGLHHLDDTWAASGYNRRTDSGNVLDWALIEVDDNRIGGNMLPKLDAILYPPGVHTSPAEKAIWATCTSHQSVSNLTIYLIVAIFSYLF